MAAPGAADPWRGARRVGRRCAGGVHRGIPEGDPGRALRSLAAGVRALYDQMVLITVEPDWAKLLDFETTIPKAVEDLVLARQGEAVVDAQPTVDDPDVPRQS